MLVQDFLFHRGFFHGAGQQMQSGGIYFFLSNRDSFQLVMVGEIVCLANSAGAIFVGMLK